MSATTAEATLSPRTRVLLHGAIVPTLLRLAWPNILVMVAQAATGLIETYWVARLGTDALAGMALVFPGFMLMQMLTGGAIGGGISSAVARALATVRRNAAPRHRGRRRLERLCRDRIARGGIRGPGGGVGGLRRRGGRGYRSGGVVSAVVGRKGFFIGKKNFIPIIPPAAQICSVSRA